MHWLEHGILPTLQYFAALCPCLPQLLHFLVNFPCVTPSSIVEYPDLSLCNSIKIGYFYRSFYAYD